MSDSRVEWAPAGKPDIYCVYLDPTITGGRNITGHLESRVRNRLGSQFHVTNRGTRLDVRPLQPNPGHTLVIAAVRAAVGGRIQFTNHRSN